VIGANAHPIVDFLDDRASAVSGLATRCEVQLAYAIGVAEPVSVMVDTFSTGAIPDERFTDLVRENFSY
jgi:S-adenosylmethionine synthetase